MADARMYIRLHDGYTDSPKIVRVGGDAGWLDVCAIGYCARNFTDGMVPKALVPRLSDRSNPLALARALVEVARWHETGHDCDRCPQPGPDEYVVHDYLEHQRSAQEVADLRMKRSEAGSKGGRAKAKALASAKQTLKQTASKPVAETETETETEEVLKNSAPSSRPARSKPDLSAFPKFWETYPNRKARPVAEKAWLKAVTKVPAEEIIAAAASYRDDPNRNPQYTAHPATWLNGERWSDERTPSGHRIVNGHRAYQNPTDPDAYLGEL